ncbi:MAG: thiosulfate oxidation carrier complex protein SoxZ [Acidiferrobacterales bacterium]
MARAIIIKTRKNKYRAGETEILALVNHPMETGRRKDKKTKKLIPAHHITKLDVELKGKLVASLNFGPAVSKRPLVGISVAGAKSGDKIKISWKDNKNESGSKTGAVR